MERLAIDEPMIARAQHRVPRVSDAHICLRYTKPCELQDVLSRRVTVCQDDLPLLASLQV